MTKIQNNVKIFIYLQILLVFLPIFLHYFYNWDRICFLELILCSILLPYSLNYVSVGTRMFQEISHVGKNMK